MYAGQTYNSIKSGFDSKPPHQTTHWNAYFGTENSGSSLNLLGTFAPVVEWTASYGKGLPFEKSVSPLAIPLQTMKMYDYPRDLSITFVEMGNDNKVRKTLAEVIKKCGFDSYEVLSFADTVGKSLTFTIDHYDPATGSVVKSDVYNLLPTSDLSLTGNQSFSLDTFSYSFMVVGCSLG